MEFRLTVEGRYQDSVWTHCLVVGLGSAMMKIHMLAVLEGLQTSSRLTKSTA